MKKPKATGAEAEVGALGAEFMWQIERVGVDMRVAFPQLREIAPPTERLLGDDGVEVSFTIDASGIVETLRTLADDAGTHAFVAAYNSSPYRDAS
jgi:hypothetical protein